MSTHGIITFAVMVDNPMELNANLSNLYYIRCKTTLFTLNNDTFTRKIMVKNHIPLSPNVLKPLTPILKSPQMQHHKKPNLLKKQIGYKAKIKT